METIMRLDSTAIRAIAFTLLTASAMAPAQEAAWPTRPVHLVVPGGPGSVTDAKSRWLAARLGPRLGQTVVVENKPGAGGILGTEFGARSAPDGYTLILVHQGTLALNPHLYAKLGYDPLKDFAPITYLGVNPLILAVPPSMPAKTLADLVRLAKDKPGQLNFGSPGVGTPPHVAAEVFKRAAGIDVMHVPYSGGGQSLAALLAGQLAFSIEGPAAQLPQVLGNRLRALAVTGSKRLPSLPDVPTMAEAGYPAAEYLSWVGIAAPARTPAPIIDRVYREIRDILATDEARESFAAEGTEPIAIPPAAFAEFIRDDYTKWGRVIHEAGIRIE
jgi:tripartite-type tricarboxylate transporter receptor subunit TctC